MSAIVRVTVALLWSLTAVALPSPVRAAGAGANLVILSPTAETRDSLPVLRIHPKNAEIAAALDRGFLSTLLRLYAMEQRFICGADSARVEPAYLLLSKNQGGFPRFGFCLGTEPKPQAGYVDLHESSRVAGNFGTMDQILPHELAHIIQRQLAGEPAATGSNQIHAVGVCTDRQTAFAEGFAEHMQVMACDDPAAAPDTRALTRDTMREAAALRRIAELRRSLCARWAPFAPARMTFFLWFSSVEQALRYHQIKANAFAYAPGVPSPLLRPARLWHAYLLENLVPGRAHDEAKPLARLLSTEGVIAAFFCRWIGQPGIGDRFRDDAFYAPFGVTADGLTSEENAYLKIFHTFHVRKPPDLVAFLDAYRELFPDEAAAVEVVEQAILLQAQPRPPPVIWLANEARTVGTSMFDQFRGLPRKHVFDLNAASVADLAGLPGVSPSLAGAIHRAAPYRELAELGGLEGMTAEVEARFRQAADDWRSWSEAEAQPQENAETSLSIGALLRPYGRRALLAWGIAAGLGGACGRLFRRREPILRSGIRGVAAGLLALLAGWLIPGPAMVPSLIAVLVAGGLPATLRTGIRSRSLRRAVQATAAWGAAAIPGAILTGVWF